MNNLVQQQLQALNRLNKECDHIYSQLASRLGLTDSAFWVLYAVAHAETPLTQNDLCSNFFFPVQTIHSAIHNLRNRGLLELQFIPGTKNRKAILLTEAGKRLVADTICRVDEMEENALRRFSEDDRALYLSLYQRHIEYLRAEEQRVLDSLPQPE